MIYLIPWSHCKCKFGPNLGRMILVVFSQICGEFARCMRVLKNVHSICSAKDASSISICLHSLAFALSKFVLTQCFGQSKTLSENKFIKMFAPNMPHICRSMPHILPPFATVCRGICANLREYHQNYPPQIRPAYAFAV